MGKEYLPGKIRERIVDLMKEQKITQKELAAKVKMSPSTLSRFLSGKTNKLKDEYITEIAKEFRVSTDFLLGEVNEPSRKNYDISELGLSVTAARNLYTGRVNAEVVCRLLENPRFADVTYLISRYLDGTLAAGYAAGNKMYDTLSDMLRGDVPTRAGAQAAREVSLYKQPIYQADLTNIEEQFMSVVKELKKDSKDDFSAERVMTKETVQEMFEEYCKGQDMANPTVVPENISDLVLAQMSAIEGADEEALSELGDSFTKFMRKTMDNLAKMEKEHDSSEQ